MLQVALAMFKDGFSTLIFTDSDCLSGDNLQNLKILNAKTKKHKGAVNIILASIEDYQTAMKVLAGKNVTTFGLD
jgi:hypothetical protein